MSLRNFNQIVYLRKNDILVYYTLFFIRIRKFCLKLAVLNSLTEPCNATKKNARLSTIKTYYFISFIFFLFSSAHRQPLGGVLQKSCSATVLKPIKKIPAKEFNFSLKLHASSLQLY